MIAVQNDSLGELGWSLSPFGVLYACIIFICISP